MKLSATRSSSKAGVFAPSGAPFVLEPTGERRPLLPLAAPSAKDPSLTGAKAAALARATAVGLPVLPGFAITTEGTADIETGGGARRLSGELKGALKTAWRTLSFDGTRPLVVRSSSTVEDLGESSMAGMFTSVLNVDGWDEFVAAVETVLNSGKIIDLGARKTGGDPMAVLVQPHLDADIGGILFGIDPVTGRRDHIAVVSAAGGPDALVSGAVEGVHHLMTKQGRLVGRHDRAQALLSLRRRRVLAQLAARAEHHFGGPQDIEWAFDHDGTLYMFQSRPVTAVGTQASGPILGPGPVAETFPDPLTTLEVDLWIPPLTKGVTEALLIAGSVSKRKIARSPVVMTVGGRVAADLELFGIATKKRSFWQRIDPLPPARRMAAAWRVGRLRAALPTIADKLVARVDDDLADLPDLRTLSDTELLNVLRRAQQTLLSLHGHEILAGLLDDPSNDGRPTGASAALRALSHGRAEGFPDDDILAISPDVLALTPPAIKAKPVLPETHGVGVTSGSPDGGLGPREALRMRIRWVQELSARCAWELGRRLTARAKLRAPGRVAQLSLTELSLLVEGANAPANMPTRTGPETPPLPAMFRLDKEGIPVPVQSGLEEGAGRGAGGGRGMGRVSTSDKPEPGEVLVVRTLDPSLAPLLPRLGGLVAETGSVLSHLAILAREFGVPTVVGVEGALETFIDGAVVVVDGTTGEVSEVTQA
ncbi:MAG: PEP/pyruvate-binding domain-containing protein [Actinomycetota bacterium]